LFVFGAAKEKDYCVELITNQSQNSFGFCGRYIVVSSVTFLHGIEMVFFFSIRHGFLVGVVKILRQDDVTIFPYGLHSGFAANGGCIGTADFFRPG
jgi:hypothetical protein